MIIQIDIRGMKPPMEPVGTGTLNDISWAVIIRKYIYADEQEKVNGLWRITADNTIVWLNGQFVDPFFSIKYAEAIQEYITMNTEFGKMNDMAHNFLGLGNT